MTFIFKDKKKKGYLQEGKSIDIPYCYQDKVVAPYKTPESLKFIREYFSNRGDTTMGVITKTIYFAHPFDKWKTKKEEMIELILEHERDYKVINPFKEEDKLNEKYGVDNYYENPTIEFANDIVNKDYEMVINCDEYFGWFPKDVTMIGTPIELVWAYIHGKKITVLCYKPQPFLWIMADRFYIGYDNFKNDIRFHDKEVHQ